MFDDEQESGETCGVRIAPDDPQRLTVGTGPPLRHCGSLKQDLCQPYFVPQFRIPIAAAPIGVYGM